MRHHLEFYANFIHNTIPETILESVPFDHDTENYHFTFRYENIYLHKPGVIENDGKVTELYPNECRLRNLTYASPLFIQVVKSFTKKLTGEKIESMENIFCGMIPVMVRSQQCRLYNCLDEDAIKVKECTYDQGGYFIVDGTERVLMGMERMCTNQVYVFPNKE